MSQVAVNIPLRDLGDYWREEPGPLDGLTWDQAAEAVLAVLDGGRPRKPKEPTPPEGWEDWPRTPEEAARRLALEWYDIEASCAEPDDMGRWICVRGQYSTPDAAEWHSPHNGIEEEDE